MPVSQPTDVPPTTSASRARVLVVDDEPSIRLLLAELLTDEGYEVRAVDDGACALDELARWTPDVMLLDLAMPGMDGYELLRRWSPGERSPSVIVLSASRHLDFAALRGYPVLRKPFEVDALLEAVRAAAHRAG